ncbi:hypothetical protein LC613_40680 [Nostoc sphaeroides CHAB 2801]|uniref:hypothetical protein n=1 Tax=Nostoc sphaeroides TaxID=446679 RepID=UPI001E2C7BB6|nr:hypothetical protein [Nostoc sphaeroides]MCC5633739.1 hypothetical protein [Nostoc sphaeroides CHAB 2801]
MWKTITLLHHLSPFILFFGEGIDDKINYFKKNEKLTPGLLWDNVKNLITIDEDAYIIFDDTVLETAVCK